jgi:hypothetical protein
MGKPAGICRATYLILTMRLIEFESSEETIHLGVVEGHRVHDITARYPEFPSVYRAFQAARRQQQKLAVFLQSLLDQSPGTRHQDYTALLAEGRVLTPVSEEDDAHLLISGTGLTHLGSVQQREQMHQTAPTNAPVSDSRKMFELGLKYGKPAPGERGVAPEWFYKGDERDLCGTEEPLAIPPFAPDGGEEPEVVGIYIIDNQGIPCRLGFAQGNEWSDHVTEKLNYLYLAPSKVRMCAIGPELVTDHPFDELKGRCRVLREGKELYDSGELLTGERHMCHSLANLEDHLFKFPQHRRPGDVHVHFFGTSKLSYPGRNWKYQTGDVVEVSFAGLGAPLRNPVHRHEFDSRPIRVESA